jgi:hypothetical protein
VKFKLNCPYVSQEEAEAAAPHELVGTALVTGPLATAVAVGALGGLDPQPLPKSAAPLASPENLVIDVDMDMTDLPEEEPVDRRNWLECACSPVRKQLGRIRLLPTEEEVAADLPKEKFSQIDINSRKIFPCAFTTLLGLYFCFYIYYITDEVMPEE